MTKLLTVEQAIDRLREGRQIVLVDDEDRENEGDLCMAAQKVTPDDINFMARFGRGLICLTLTEARAQQLGLTKMTERNRSRFGTNFYTSIEAREGVTTGISASDRATTIASAVAPDAGPDDIVSPGHVFPICAREGGVLVRSGQTEGSVDLARLAGFEPSGVICEIMKDDGTMARMPDLEQFAQVHGLGILTIEQLIQYRLQRESLVMEEVDTAVRPDGIDARFKLRVFKSSVNEAQYMALVLGEVRGDEPVLVRMHRASIPSDVFGIQNSDSSDKKRRALEMIAQAGAGVFVYVHPGQLDLVRQVEAELNGKQHEEPKGEGLPPELRDFGLGAQVLASLGVSKIRLMTGNPKRIVGLKSYGLEVVECITI